MRNLKKYLAALLVVAMMITAMAPAFAAASFSYEGEAQSLYNLGLYKGIDTTKFVPDLGTTLDRQTGATMVLRMFGLEEEALKLTDAEAKELNKKFKDAAQIKDWAAKQVAYAVKIGVIKGNPDGTFKPAAPLNAKAYTSMILQLLGHTDFNYATAPSALADKGGLTADEAKKFTSDAGINKDSLVGISYGTLFAQNKDGKKLGEVLVANKVVDADKAVAENIVAATPATTAPATTPATTANPAATVTPAATSVPGTVYGAVSVKAEMATAMSVAKGQALLEIGKVTLTAANDTVVNGVKLTRSGLSADTDISNVTVFDGTTRLNTPVVLSNNVADVTFTSAVTVKAGESKTLSIKANVATGATTGAQMIFTINSVSDIKTASTATVTGTFPASSGALTVTQVTLGLLTTTLAGDAPSGNVDIQNDVALTKIKLEATNEALKLNNITFTQNGSAADSDITNLKLFNGSKQVGTTVSLSARKATFVFTTPVDLAMGSTTFLELRGDIVSGSGRNIRFDLDNVNDAQATGVTYGTTVVATATVQGTISANGLTINPGSLVVSKSSTSPAAGTVSRTVVDQKFAAITVQAVGEPITINKIKVAATTTSGNLYDLTNLKITVGSTVAKQVQEPFGTSSNSKTSPQEISVDPIKVAPNTTVTIGFSANLTNATQGNIYKLGVDTNGIIYSTDVSGKTDQVATNTLIYGSEMTVGTLNITPSAVTGTNETVFSSDTGVLLGQFTLKHNLTEDVNVSNVEVNFTNTNASLINNLKVVDASGNPISDVVISPNNTQALRFKSPITVKASEDKVIGIVGDIKYFSSIPGSPAVEITMTDVTAVTVANGTDVPKNTAVTSGTPRTMTLSLGGSNVVINRSDIADLDNANVTRSAKNVKVAAFTVKQEGTTNTYEVNTVTFAGTVDTGDVVTVTVDTVPYTYTQVAGDTTTTILASNVAALLNTKTDVTAKWTVTSAAAVVTLTAKTYGNKTNVSSSVADTDVDLAVATATAAEATAGNASVVEPAILKKIVLSKTGSLSSAYASNIRIVDSNGNTLASTPALSGAKELDLNLEIPKETDKSVEIAVLADFASDATYAETYGIKVGDVSTLNDFEYQTKTTGLTSYGVGYAVGSNSANAVTTFSVVPTSLQITSVAIANPIGDSNAYQLTGNELARFAIKNTGSESIALKNIRLDDVLSSTKFFGVTPLAAANAANTNYRVYNADDGDILTEQVEVSSTASNQNALDLRFTTVKSIAPGSTLTISIKVGDTAGTGRASSAASLRMLKANTTYVLTTGAGLTGGFVANSSQAFSVGADCTANQVTVVKP